MYTTIFSVLILLPVMHGLSLSALKPKQEFLARLESSMQQESMVKLLMNFAPTSTTTVPHEPNQVVEGSPIALFTHELKSLSLRPVIIKRESKIQCLFTYKTNVITKNYRPSMEKGEQLNKLMNAAMRKSKFARLETLDLNVELVSKRGEGKIKVSQKNKSDEPNSRDLSHDRQKSFIIDPKEPFLFKLGIMSSKGRPLSGMSDKYRQIQKFTEIITSLVEKGVGNVERKGGVQKRPRIRLTDMGCGLGYLTFAAHTSLIRSYENCITIGDH